MSNPHVTDVTKQEADKYSEIWSHPDYQVATSPGLANVERFMSVMKPAVGSTIVDIGCGAGVAGMEFQKAGMRVHWLDITDAGLIPAVDRSLFLQYALWDPRWPHRGRSMGWDYGFCCDVLEHIPPEYTMLCIDRMMRRCRTVWLQIALRPDVYGPKLLGEPLHLSVYSFDWWKVRIATIAKIVDARDLIDDGLYILEQRQ